MGKFSGFCSDADSPTKDVSASSDDFLFHYRERKLRQETLKQEFLKCSTIDALRTFIRNHKNETDNPFVEQAKEKLDGLDFKKCQSSIYDLGQYRKDHPNGKHIAESIRLENSYRDKYAQKELNRANSYRDKYAQKELNRANRKNQIENIGITVALILLVLVFLLSFFGTDASFIEAGGAAIACAAPIYGIARIVSSFYD